MSVFGWCAAGPPDSIPQHAKPDGTGCPGNIGGADGLWCSCRCHRQGGIGLETRDPSVGAWDTGETARAGSASTETDPLATISTKPKGA